MNYEKFIISFLRKGTNFTSSSRMERTMNPPTRPYQITPYWFFRRALAKATKTIDYGCEFDDKGLCGHRGKAFKGTSKSKLDEIAKGRRGRHPTMCCCGGCFEAKGYFNELPASLDIVKHIASLFNTKNRLGFWRKGKGCILPRSLRSDTCLLHRCTIKKMTLKDRFLLELLNNGRSGETLIEMRKHVYNRWATHPHSRTEDPKLVREITDWVFDTHMTPTKKRQLGLTEGG